MPGSAIQGKAESKQWLYSKPDIKTILDVGAGSATYPHLLGLDRFEYYAIEIWEPYIEMFGLKEIYKEIVIGDVRLCRWPKTDCIIFGDIIEHLPKQDGLNVLQRANKEYPHMILSIPVTKEGLPTPGAIHYGNPNEAHISGWTYSELKNMFSWENSLESKGLGVFMK
jgi:hypothetical protein